MCLDGKGVEGRGWEEFNEPYWMFFKEKWGRAWGHLEGQDTPPNPSFLIPLNLGNLKGEERIAILLVFKKCKFSIFPLWC